LSIGFGFIARWQWAADYSSRGLPADAGRRYVMSVGNAVVAGIAIKAENMHAFTGNAPTICDGLGPVKPCSPISTIRRFVNERISEPDAIATAAFS